MFCKYCGKEVYDGALFCPNCDSALEATTEIRHTNHAKKVTFLNAIGLFFKNYFNFSGSSTRAEFWWSVLFNLMTAIPSGLLAYLLIILDFQKYSIFLPFIGSIIPLFLLIPNLALIFRRLHDTGKSGLYIFIAFIPIVGSILLLIQYCKPSLNHKFITSDNTESVSNANSKRIGAFALVITVVVILWLIVGIIFAVKYLNEKAFDNAADLSKNSSISQSSSNIKSSSETAKNDSKTNTSDTEPSPYEIFKDLEISSSGDAAYTLNDKAGLFLQSHSNLFPCNDLSIVRKMTAQFFGYKSIIKNVSKCCNKLIWIKEANVIQIREIEYKDKMYISHLNITDEADNQYYVIYLGELDHVYDDCLVTVFALPIGIGHIENGYGYSLEVPILAGSYIQELV